MRRRPAKSQRHGRVKRCGKPSRDRHSSTADLQEQLALRTQELSQALEQQTATADVLKIISRSDFDLQAVLDTLAQSASRVCNGDGAGLAVREDEVYRYVANFAQPDEFCTLLRK